MAAPNVSGTALKAFKVLDFVAAKREPVTVADVVNDLGIDRASAYRMLLTLVESRYVTRATDRSYRLSPKVMWLAQHLLEDDTRDQKIASCLRTISEQTQETVHYSVLDGNAAVLAKRAKGTQRVAVDFQIGDRSPLHCSSVGKVLLAYGEPQLTDTIVAQGLPKVAPNTITDPEAFRAELKRIRAERCAFDDLEFADDMRCIAVPVFEAAGSVPGSIAISGPASRFDLAKLEELRVIIQQHADDLSRELGWSVGGDSKWMIS
ncbi:MAG: IclR family transcriptional regulator [Phycisphaerales bacterium]